jgi:pyruvate-formate lyase
MKRGRAMATVKRIASSSLVAYAITSAVAVGGPNLPSAARADRTTELSPLLSAFTSTSTVSPRQGKFAFGPKSFRTSIPTLASPGLPDAESARTVKDRASRALDAQLADDLPPQAVVILVGKSEAFVEQLTIASATQIRHETILVEASMQTGANSDRRLDSAAAVSGRGSQGPIGAGGRRFVALGVVSVRMAGVWSHFAFRTF